MNKDLVAGLIIDNDKILLVHNTKHATTRIEPPGGKKEAGETSQQAVKRELQEELGIEVKVGKLFGVYDTDSPEGQFSVHTYFCSIVSGNPSVTEPDKISNFDWYSFSDLEKLNEEGSLVPNMVKSLEKIKVHLSK